MGAEVATWQSASGNAEERNDTLLCDGSFVSQQGREGKAEYVLHPDGSTSN